MYVARRWRPRTWPSPSAAVRARRAGETARRKWRSTLAQYPAAGTPQETIDGTRRINDVIKGTGLPPVPEDELEKIIHRNSLELLDLE